MSNQISVMLEDVYEHCLLKLEVEQTKGADRIEAQKELVHFRNRWNKSGQRTLDRYTAHVYSFRNGERELTKNGDQFQWV